MTLTGAYVALGSGVVVWGLLVSRLRARSWLTKGPEGAVHEGGATALPPGLIGFWTFLGVITSLFALFIAAYHMRMMDGIQHGDWQHVPIPKLLWVNSLVLMLGSVAMQWARSAAARDDRSRLVGRLGVAGLLSAAFLAGQLLAWRELGRTEYFSPSNPAVAFFYLLTAVHGLHVLGGMAVWARTAMQLRSMQSLSPSVQLTVGLCTVYWHYLLIVWLVLFGLMLST